MSDNVNTAYEVRVFISKLQKGDTFVLGKRNFEVASKTKEGNLKLHIEGVGTKRLLFKYGDYYGTMGRNIDWFDNYFRDIEGVIIVDLLNANNPFHEKSVFSKYISS